MLTCKKCGSNNVSVEMVTTSGSTKKYGNGFGGHMHNMGRKVLGFGTLGMSNLFVKKRKGEERMQVNSEKMYICQNCGFSSTGMGFSKKPLPSTQSPSLKTDANLPNESYYSPLDPTVRKAVEIAIKKGSVTPAFLQSYLGKGHGYVAGLIAWLKSIDVINSNNEAIICSMKEFDKIAITQLKDS